MSERRGSVIAPDVMNVPAQLLHDVKGDGSCFFRSLFHAARSSHCLDRVAAAFRYESKEGSDYTEAHFVHCVRRYLSVEICSNQRSMQLHAAFESMCELVEQAHLPDDRHRSSKIKVIGDDHDRPDWFTAYFSTTPPSLFCFEPFLASCQAAVCINSMYAGDLDIRMVTATLATYGITVDIGHDHDLPSKIVPLPDTLYLRRVRGNHYNWMDFLPPRNHGDGVPEAVGHLLRHRTTIRFKRRRTVTEDVRSSTKTKKAEARIRAAMSLSKAVTGSSECSNSQASAQGQRQGQSQSRSRGQGKVAANPALKAAA